MGDNNSTSDGRHARLAWTASADGARAEDLAARFLEARGLSIVARNVHCRGGEIDLVARDAATLVFVEVRRRSRSDFGGAAASITAAKRRRIVLAAQHYLAGKPACDCRFDCVLIDGGQLEWVPNAFTADD